MHNREFLLLSFKLFHWRWFSIVLTLAVYWYLFNVKRAAVLCTISTWSVRLSVYGSYTIYNFHAFAFIAGELILRWRQRKPKVLFALLGRVLTCVVHFKSLWTFTPRYFADFRCSRGCPCNWYSQWMGVYFLWLTTQNVGERGHSYHVLYSMIVKRV